MRYILLFLLFPLSLTAQPHAFSLNVQDFGATGQADQTCTDIIQAAIDSAHIAGGGVVYFPPGDYLSGSIHLKSNVTLYLEAGSTILASREEKDYTLFGWGGRRPILIWAKDAHHIALRGKGRIDGQAEHTYEDLKEVDKFIAREIELAREAGIEMKRWYKVPPFVRTVNIEGCTDVHVEDITIVNSQSWLLDVKYCQRVFIHGVHLRSDLEKGVNADGIDIDGCKDVVVSDCVVQTGDDAIVVKANYSKEYDFNCENVTVTNCVVTSTSTGLKIGTESYGNFKHILFQNCSVRNSNRGLSIVIRDGAVVEDVIFSNITMETDRKHFNWWGDGDAIWVVIKKRRASSKVGKIDGLVFHNILAKTQGSSRFIGFPGDSLSEAEPIRGIRMEQVHLQIEPEDLPDHRADHGLYMKGVEDVSLRDVSIRWNEETPQNGWGSAFWFENVQRIRAQGLVARQGLQTGDAPVIQGIDIQDAVFRFVEALPGSHTLLDVKGADSRNIRLIDPLGPPDYTNWLSVESGLPKAQQKSIKLE